MGVGNFAEGFSTPDLEVPLFENVSISTWTIDFGSIWVETFVLSSYRFQVVISSKESLIKIAENSVQKCPRHREWSKLGIDLTYTHGQCEFGNNLMLDLLICT